MFKKYQNLIRSPFFEGEEEKTWHADLFNIITICGLVVVSLVVIGNLLGKRVPLGIYILDSLMFLIILFLRRFYF